MASVGGWVFEDNVRNFMEHLSAYVGYSFDDSDWLAVATGLADTDEGRSYDYPIAGTPPLTVFVARDSSGAHVDVKVDGHVDSVLAARIEMLLDVL